MNLKENIKRILKEETSLSIKLKNLIDTKGIDFASSVVGGMKNVAKILNLDLNDVDTQEMLVKNFIQHTKVDEIDVQSVDVKPSASGGKILTVNFKTDDTSLNVTSWYVTEICNYLNKELFPFRVQPSWNPVFASGGCKIFLDANIIGDEEDENIVTENHINPSLRRRFSQDLDDLEIRKIIRVVMGDKYLEDYVHYDSFVDDVVMGVSDYLFDENNISISDGNNYSLHRELYDYLMDEYSGMIIKYYKSHTEDEDELYENTELTERCWKGYTQKGMKTMFGKRYPNCVKIKK
jgi:hypothetical protein